MQGRFQDRIQREYMTSSDELDSLRLQLQIERREFEQKLMAVAVASGDPGAVRERMERMEEMEKMDKTKEMERVNKVKGEERMVGTRTSMEWRRRRIEGRSEGREGREAREGREVVALSRRDNTVELKQKLATAEESVARERQRVDLFVCYSPYPFSSSLSPSLLLSLSSSLTHVFFSAYN